VQFGDVDVSPLTSGLNSKPTPEVLAGCLAYSPTPKFEGASFCCYSETSGLSPSLAALEHGRQHSSQLNKRFRKMDLLSHA
jgi:hypothetical protein